MTHNKFPTSTVHKNTVMRMNTDGDNNKSPNKSPLNTLPSSVSSTIIDDSEIEVDNWSYKIESILDKIRINSIYMSNYHNTRYQYYKGKIVYFRIPLIVLSSMNSFIAVGLQSYINQSTISLINCFLSMICGIITSIELFFNVQKKIESEMTSMVNYYKISIEIYKVLSIEKSNRAIDGKLFLDQKFSEYTNLVQNSNVVIEKFFDDTLAPTKSMTSYIRGSFSNKYNRRKQYIIEKKDEENNNIYISPKSNYMFDVYQKLISIKNIVSLSKICVPEPNHNYNLPYPLEEHTSSNTPSNTHSNIGVVIRNNSSSDTDGDGDGYVINLENK
jgi:hypothetical protein